MSLTISPHGSAAGFNPKAYPIIASPKKVSSNPEIKTNLANADVQVNLSHLEIVKIIPDGGTNGGNNISSDRSLMNSKTDFNINTKSDELVEKIIDPGSVEDV